VTPEEIQEILKGALRQYKHNHGGEGFVFAYDKEEIDLAMGDWCKAMVENQEQKETIHQLTQIYHAAKEYFNGVNRQAAIMRLDSCVMGYQDYVHDKDEAQGGGK
jgi:hypothetical protein